MKNELLVRNVRCEDLGDILQIEAARNGIPDHDFEVIRYNPWMVDAEELTRRLKEVQNNDYRWRIRVIQNGVGSICGAFTITKEPNSWECDWFVSNLNFDTCETVAAIAKHLSAQAKKTKRKFARVYLRDDERASLSEYLPAWKVWLNSCGFAWSVSLRRDFFSVEKTKELQDAWVLEWEVK